jgi:hypothetical protein
MNKRTAFIFFCLFGIVLVRIASPVWAGYKARNWNMGTPDSYPSKLTSEGVTVAVEPFYTNALAAQVFDKNDIVTRGIMPLAVIIFNDNDFPIRVDGLSIELIRQEDHIRTLMPNEVVYRIFKKEKSWISQQIPIPQISRPGLNQDALNDFDAKFLSEKTIAPHEKGGGFLYMHPDSPENLGSYLESAIVYIPKIYRQDNGTRLIFFEIGLSAAVKATPQP